MPRPATHSWSPGAVVAEKYLLLRPLARGGMGSVWVAQNRATERRVAIKFVLPELAENPEAIQRFFREARASARIDHPSIVDALDLGTLPEGAPFLVMELLEGKSLEEVIERAPIAPLQAVAVMLDVARALRAAHAVGIVHRDLKPANIFLARRGEAIVPKILDFGISTVTSSGNPGDVRMTRAGALMGSPAYMSPEQARGKLDIDGRADIWAVGVILYEAVSKKLPFGGENYNQTMMSIAVDPPTPLRDVAPDVDDGFLAIVDACLQKDRDARPASMEALATLLEDYVAAHGTDAIAPLDLGQSHPPKSTKVGSQLLAAKREVVSVIAGDHSPSLETKRTDPALDAAPASHDDDASHAASTGDDDAPDPEGARADHARHPTVGPSVSIVEAPKPTARRPIIPLIAAAALAAIVGVLLLVRGAHRTEPTDASQTRDEPGVASSTVPSVVPPPPATHPAVKPAPHPIHVPSISAPTSSTPSIGAVTTPGKSLAKPKATPVPTNAKSPAVKKKRDDGPAQVGNGPGF